MDGIGCRFCWRIPRGTPTGNTNALGGPSADTVFVGNFAPTVNRALVRQTRGSRDSTVVYDAHWEGGELVVETDEPVRLIQGDTLWVELTFSEGMDDTIRVTLEGPYAGLPFATVRWDSVVHPRDRWVGRYPLTTWDSIRNLMAGERRLVIWAEDAVTRNALDTNPATAAYWDDEAEQWVGYEGDDGLPGQTGGQDLNHRLRIEPWNHVCLVVDASSSMNLDNWNLSQVRSPQRLVGWMMAQEESADYQVAAWRFYSSSVEQLAGYDFELDDAQAALWMAVPQFQGTNEPGQPNPANPPGWIPMTDVETAVVEARAYAAGEYDDPAVICVWSDFWHNLGSADTEVEATYQAVAESSVLFLFTNPGAMYGSECTAVQQQAAWRSGGGYYEGFSASEVESLYRVIPRVWRSRAMGVQMNGSGSDTIGVWVDSTMTRLDVIASLAPWSERGMAKRRGALGGEAPCERGTYELKDPTGSVVAPSYSATGVKEWEVEGPMVGRWVLEVSEEGEYSVTASGGSPIELRLLSVGSIAEGARDTIRVKLEWAALEDEEFELVDEYGEVEGALVMEETGIREYAGAYTFEEGGAYRVRIRGRLGTQTVERETMECVMVRAAPELVITGPAPGEADTAWIRDTIRWEDECRERNGVVTIGYDADGEGGDGPVLWSGPENDDQAPDTLVWTLGEGLIGTWHIWGRIEDGLNEPVVVYGGTVTVRRPATIVAPVTLADVEGDGTVEVLVGSADSLLHCLTAELTERPGFPVHCQGAISAGVAVGDVDGDGGKEMVVATGDYGGPAYVWVLDSVGDVKPGWPVEVSQGTRSTPLLVNLVGAASSPPEIVVAGYDSVVHAWTGNGSVVAGWPRKLSGMIQDSSPVGGDIDGDGQNEVVVARTGVWPQGAIVALETDGTIKWEKATPSYVWSAPALWDVDKDRRPEVIVATSQPDATGLVYVLNGENGSDAAGWSGGKNIGQGSWASPAVGYLNLGDEPRIVVVNGAGEVRAYGRSGTLVWSKDVSGYQVKTSPLIVDIDGDMSTEIVLATRYRLCVLAGATGDTIGAYCKPLSTDTQSTPGVGDLDGDGDLEIVAADGEVIRCWEMGGSVWGDGQEWGQFKRDEGKTGRYRESASPKAPEVEGIEVVAPDSLRIRWKTVREDVYGRPEWLRRYRVYRGSGAYQGTWGTQVGQVNAPDTVYVERPGTVGDPNASSYYRVKAEDVYGNVSALSEETVGEFERSTGAAVAKGRAEGER